MNNVQQQYNNNKEAVAVVGTASAQAEQQHQGAAHDFAAAFNDEHIFNIEEDALLSSIPSATAALTSSSTTTVVGSADDFFSSPEWTDPSPALTSSMSFNMDSCDPSPLLADVHEAPDLSGMPLFGDHLQFSFLQAQQIQNKNNVVDAQNLHSTPASTTTSAAAATNRLSPQLAFNRVKKDNEQSALLLLRAFNNQALINNVPGLDVEAEEQATASPAAILSPLPLAGKERQAERKASVSRGTKRRVEAVDLLPLDAPIQSRTYKTPSATSRKSSSSSLEQAPSTPDVGSSSDPLTAKRLSNTLAARRSRHRKAEELRQLHDTIEELQAQVEMWKRRCVRAEQERDEAFGGQA